MSTNPTSQNPSKNNTRTGVWSGIVVMAVVIIAAISDISRTMSNATYNTRLSTAIPGGLEMSFLSEGTNGLLMSAFVVKTIALIAVAGFIAATFPAVARGDFFSRRVERFLSLASASTVVWMFARYGLEGLGNNMAAHEYGLDHWYETTAGTPVSDMAFALIFTVIITLFGVAARRGRILEEEVEGLV